WSSVVYGLAVVLVGYLLLAPYNHGAAYLLHVDARARSEGLDLRYRVLRLFSLRGGKRASVVLLAVSGWMWSLSPAAAAGLSLASAPHARAEGQAGREAADAAHPRPEGAPMSA